MEHTWHYRNERYFYLFSIILHKNTILWQCCLRTIDLFSLDTLMYSGHWVFISYGRGLISHSKGPKGVYFTGKER